MPPSADEVGQQESLLNLDPILQEGSGARKKSPKGKKKKRKDESPTEGDTAKAGRGGEGRETGLDRKMYVSRDIYGHIAPNTRRRQRWHIDRFADVDIIGRSLLQVSSRNSTKLKPSDRLLQRQLRRRLRHR